MDSLPRAGGDRDGDKAHIQEWVRVSGCLRWALRGQWDTNLKARMRRVLGEIPLKLHNCGDGALQLLCR